MQTGRRKFSTKHVTPASLGALLLLDHELQLRTLWVVGTPTFGNEFYLAKAHKLTSPRHLKAAVGRSSQRDGSAFKDMAL